MKKLQYLLYATNKQLIQFVLIKPARRLYNRKIYLILKSLTNGNGFYKLEWKESISLDRRMIVRDIKKNVLIEEVTVKRRPGEFLSIIFFKKS